jgi:hypothetical protein
MRGMHRDILMILHDHLQDALLRHGRFLHYDVPQHIVTGRWRSWLRR